MLPELSPDLHEVLDAHHTTLQDVRGTLTRLEHWLARLNTPAELRTVPITPDVNPVTDNLRKDRVTMSIGILNPTALNVFAGVNGGSATQAARAIPVPAQSLLVLPVAVDGIELGVDPAALGTDTAVVFLLRFDTVQPATLQVLR